MQYANHYGQIFHVINQKRCRLLLSLGALAEIEQIMDQDIMSITEDMQSGKLSIQSIMVILRAALYAADRQQSVLQDDDLVIEGGITEAYRLSAELFLQAFHPSPAKHKRPAP